MKKLALVVVAFACSACTTVCFVGVREAAARACEAGESWEQCLPKAEIEAQAAQEQAVKLLQSAAAH